ncbi:uncharacterized protein K460DRAFT_184715 [Cucurbitaria berberidis CBS 394.84]|uniref:C2H2-type domain-containing protein n=1 Tax=Cucurbitaria berberidis CBS 394.84 TaxID=1168544 RepID=A0A9P4GB96_9PLEO|nr:uncharacterized protein K460DRAFT_184715 [Cucurbitaria berberidis CBS 394.84]KAF1842415.1 hypothetical protein K460DRAFT_184715 [Cucurbitaria berberidis CBS 394.84]
MDARQQEYPQSDPASAAQYPPQGQDPRSSNLTPTSDYSLNPSSARSGSFPEYIQRSYQPGAQGQAPGDPSIAAQTSPTYPQHQQYSPYTPHHDMQHYPGQPQTPMYASRPEWAGHYPQPGMHYAHAATSGPPAPAMVSPVQRPPTYPQGGHPLSTVYSFVPIPGAQQHKRPRRRYEEIERMYKCGWNGCEKAYGTLNHLNAHVTMQSHGAKRTPEEFKEIRKEWKAKKKEEEAARKADEERHRADVQQRQHDGVAPGEPPVYGQMRQAVGVPGQPPQHPQLPPIGYQPAASSNTAAPQYGTQSPGLPEGMAHYPQSPYGQNPQMYSQGH